MIIKATLEHLDDIERIYNEIHDQEESGKVIIGWNRKIYPTRITAKESIDSGDMFVLVDNNEVVGAARINQQQVPEYCQTNWQYDVKDNEVMVLHTLVVSPNKKGHGYGKQMVSFYEQYALEHHCHYLRMDTNERNHNARALYHKLGYDEVGVVPCIFNGIEGVSLLCLEKKL